MGRRSGEPVARHLLDNESYSVRSEPKTQPLARTALTSSTALILHRDSFLSFADRKHARPQPDK
jgi:hypothetical protein